MAARPKPAKAVPPKEAGKAAQQAATLFCTFCGKSSRDVRALIAGPAIFICDACVGLCVEIIAKLPPGGEAAPARIEWPANVPTENLLGLLKNQDSTLEQVRERLQITIDTLRARKVSWEKIGKAMGVSRQAAWERFG